MKTLTITQDTTEKQISNYLYSNSEKRIDFDGISLKIKNMSKIMGGYSTKYLFGFMLKGNNGVVTLEKY